MPRADPKAVTAAILTLVMALPIASSCAPDKPPVPRTAEEQLVEMQMTLMAQQTVGDYLLSEGIMPNGVIAGPPKRVVGGWDFVVYRREDPDKRTVIHVKETAEVAAEDLEILRPDLPDATFTPRQTEDDPNAALRQP